MATPSILQPAAVANVHGGTWGAVYWMSSTGVLALANDTTPLPVTGTFTADSEFVTAAALNGTWARTTVTTIGGAALMLSDGTNLVLGVGGTGVDSTGVIRVSLATNVALPAGEAVIGKVVGVSTVVSSTVVFTDTNARATGDYCGTTTTPQAFLLASRVAGNCAVIKSIRIVDYLTTAEVALELWLFSATFVAPADNAAWTITDSEALTCLGVIPIATTKWYASALNTIYTDDTLSLIIKPAVTSLFYAIVARGTTPAWTTSTPLVISLGILQD